MDLDIKQQKKNPLMKRVEYAISIEHTGKPTPSRQEILKEIAKKTKCKEDLLIVDNIFTDAGKSTSSVRALAYSKTQDIPKGKLEKMKTRMQKKEEPAEARPVEAEQVAEKPAEAKEEAELQKPEEKEEAPKEEPKPEGVPEKPAEPTEPKPEEEKKPEENDEEKPEEKPEEKEKKEEKKGE